LDARESCKDAQDPSRKKLAFRLPATFPLTVRPMIMIVKERKRSILRQDKEDCEGRIKKHEDKVRPQIASSEFSSSSSEK
jgi:hypothetical protein